jgi:hypothetical protein
MLWLVGARSSEVGSPSFDQAASVGRRERLQKASGALEEVWMVIRGRWSGMRDACSIQMAHERWNANMKIPTLLFKRYYETVSCSTSEDKMHRTSV